MVARRLVILLLTLASTQAWVNPRTASVTRGSPLQASFLDFLKPKQTAPAPEVPQFEPRLIDPDFRCAALFLVPGLLLDTIPYIQLTLGPIVTLLGLLFLVQTFRIRFRFNEDNALELATVADLQGNLQESGENMIVGGANVWACDTIVNYDFFPNGWIDSPWGAPILVYFKETQTPADKWNEGPGERANDPAKIAAGEAVAGQVHFFPCVCNPQQIREEFEKRNCGKL